MLRVNASCAETTEPRRGAGKGDWMILEGKVFIDWVGI